MPFDPSIEDLIDDFRCVDTAYCSDFELPQQMWFARDRVEVTRRASNEHGMHQEIWRRIVDRILELEKMVEYHAQVRDAVEYFNNRGIMKAHSNASHNSPDDKRTLPTPIFTKRLVLYTGDVGRSFETEHDRYLMEIGVDTVFREPLFGVSRAMTALYGFNIAKIASPDHPAKTIFYGRHQDTKSKNILTFEEEHSRWLISDFGRERFHGYHKRSCSPLAKLLTESDALYHGTKHQPPTCIPHSFDIWSLGCVLLETGALLTTSSVFALVINGYHGSLPSGTPGPIWAEDENRSPIIQLLTKILSKSSMTENIPPSHFITAPTPGEFITASLVYGLATTTFYYRQRRCQRHHQHQKRLGHSYSSSHEHYVLLAGIISPFALGHFLGLDTRGAVMQLMPWTILAALIISATLHRLLSLAERMGLRGKLGNAKVTDVESSLGMDDGAARVKGGI